MKRFMDENFLLENETARRLFSFSKDLPIVDYHCHLSAKDIFEDRQFSSIGSLWLDHDHYKWRLMRANAIPEHIITGKGDVFEKFVAFSNSLKYAIGNPVYHWSMLELQRYFDFKEPLTEDNVKHIWVTANAIIKERCYSPRKMIELAKVQMLCTTEDPCADLKYHFFLKKDFPSCKVLPAFRPDRFLAINEVESFCKAISDLEILSNTRITDYKSLKTALQTSMDCFLRAGCVASDHDINYLIFNPVNEETMDSLIEKALKQETVSESELHQYRTTLLLYLARCYAERSWAMELHFGCNRNQNMSMVEEIGQASGFDSVGDYPIAYNLGLLFNELEKEKRLPKTILFSLNPKDNWTLAALANTFQSEEVLSKIQLGAAWWMQDHKVGMEQQMLALANTGLLGHFIGMLTDSRSFLSFIRHEYFRRVLCNFIGDFVEKGEFPNDDEMLRTLVEGICYKNAISYFNVG